MNEVKLKNSNFKLFFVFFFFTFTADENLLRTLPNEICSCSNLSILSVRGNKLTKIPIDIGRLTQMRVLNIVNNFLSNLPVTILNLTQLSALWISDNQSQPLMPLQKEFHKETQSFYLTCYLLPQVYTSNSTPTTNATSTAPESTYDYYSPSTCDTSQTNMHIEALENLSLAAIAQNRKRKICFASDPPQEIAPNLRLMRSPTPYPKELRMMQAKFAANKMQQQQQHMQRYAQQENNLDKQSNKLLNTMNAENIMNQPQSTNSNDFETVNHLHAMPPMMNNIANEIGHVGIPNMNGSNLNVPGINVSTNMNVPPRQNPPTHQPNLEYNTIVPRISPNPSNYGDVYRSESRMQTPTLHNNDLVQYDSLNVNHLRRNISGLTDETVDYVHENDIALQIPDMTQHPHHHQPYRSPIPFDDTNSINNGNDMNTNEMQSFVTNDIESNHNNLYADATQVKFFFFFQLSLNQLKSIFEFRFNQSITTLTFWFFFSLFNLFKKTFSKDSRKK